jgi:hypothetical protein
VYRSTLILCPQSVLLFYAENCTCPIRRRASTDSVDTFGASPGSSRPSLKLGYRPLQVISGYQRPSDALNEQVTFPLGSVSTKRTTRHVPTSLSASPPANATDEGGINIAAPASINRDSDPSAAENVMQHALALSDYRRTTGVGIAIQDCRIPALRNNRGTPNLGWTHSSGTPIEIAANHPGGLPPATIMGSPSAR